MNSNQNPQQSNPDMEESIFIFILGLCIFSFITTIVSVFIIFYIQADTDSFFVPMNFESGGAYESIWIFSGITFLVTLGLLLRACSVAKRKNEAYKKYMADLKEKNDNDY